MPPAFRSALLLLALLPLAGCSSGCSSGGSARSSGSGARFDGAVFPPDLHAHGFTLTDQNGMSVSLESYRNHVRLLAFLSASKRGSLLVAQQIRGALDELGAPDSARVATLIVSIDPRDTPTHVKRFLNAASLEGRVEYLTGPPPRLRATWKAYGIVPASAGEGAFLASTPILLVDRSGVERVGFAVEQLTPEGLAHDLRALLSG
jgi:protein SCO1